MEGDDELLAINALGHENLCKKILKTMPLVTIAGLPLSGKTTRANELKAFLLENAIRKEGSALNGGSVGLNSVVIVNEEELGIDKKTAYTGIYDDGRDWDILFAANYSICCFLDADSEKKVRGRIMSAIERHLSRDDVVICDYLNYSK